jgi:alpha-N-arabinofuranosidase
VEIPYVDPNRSVDIDLAVAGMTPSSATGQTLAAPKVDSVNTFDAPNAVVPKPISATAKAGRLTLTVEPKSVTVVAVQ